MTTRSGHFVTAGNALLILLLAGYLYLFFSGLSSYGGSSLAYVIFSISFFLPLVVLFRQTGRGTYVYACMAALLWLGFWWKLTFRLSFPYPWVEPIGNFSDSAENWDLVLEVAIASAAGLLLSRVAFSALRLAHPSSLVSSKAPLSSWLGGISLIYPTAIFVVLAAALVYANVRFGIARIGFKTTVILPYSMNALVSLMLHAGGGLCILMTSLLYWRIIFGKSIVAPVATFCAVALMVSITSLSRGIIVGYLFPVALALYMNRSLLGNFSRGKAVALIALCGLLVAATFYVSTTIRLQQYYDDPKVAENAEMAGLSKQDPRDWRFLSQKVLSLIHFSVDRWTGIEGVMAVTAYPDKGWDLFRKAVFEKRTDSPKVYEIISPTPEPAGLRTDVAFSTIPGGVGFLYYSGSVWFVFAMTFAIALLLQILEYLAFSVTRNPLLASSVGFSMAMLFVHQWGVPYYVIPIMTFSALLIGVVAVVQSRWLGNLLGSS